MNAASGTVKLSSIGNSSMTVAAVALAQRVLSETPAVINGRFNQISDAVIVAKKHAMDPAAVFFLRKIARGSGKRCPPIAVPTTSAMPSPAHKAHSATLVAVSLRHPAKVRAEIETPYVIGPNASAVRVFDDKFVSIGSVTLPTPLSFGACPDEAISFLFCRATALISGSDPGRNVIRTEKLNGTIAANTRAYPDLAYRGHVHANSGAVVICMIFRPACAPRRRLCTK